jgi:hypothetical protein
MKSEYFYLINTTIRDNCIKRIGEIDLKANVKVTLSDARSLSSRQKGLMWFWNRDVAHSGFGGAFDDDLQMVHLHSKAQFALPIFIRDSSFFAELYNGWKQLHGDDRGAMMWFVKHQVSTSKFSTSQMAEYLNEFMRCWGDKGVRLTDPQDRRLLQK